MTLPGVVMLSMWKDDSERDLKQRALRLLSKTYPALRWVWVVGDSEDDTEARLRALVVAHPAGERVTIVRHDTGIVGDDPETRLLRLSETANAWWPEVREDDAYCLIHESDIDSPPDLVERFLATGKCPVAGWPLLKLGSQWLFYDSFVYRKDGVRFTNTPPYHACYRPGEVFEVDSVGTVWMFYAEDVRAGARCDRMGALDLCRWMRERGRRIYVDSTLVMYQPVELWTPQEPVNDL